MVSLNPFKKKEEKGYSLDSHELPSLSQVDSQQSQNSAQSSSNPNLSSQSQPPFSQINPQQSQNPAQSPSNPNSSSQSQQDFSNPFQQPSSMQPEDLSQPSNMKGKPLNNTQGDTNYHQDYSKAKLDSIDSKVALLEAKFSSLEQKVDTILTMVSEEVSEDTKAKIQKKSVQNTLRQKQQ